MFRMENKQMRTKTNHLQNRSEDWLRLSVKAEPAGNNTQVGFVMR